MHHLDVGITEQVPNPSGERVALRDLADPVVGDPMIGTVWPKGHGSGIEGWGQPVADLDAVTAAGVDDDRSRLGVGDSRTAGA